MNNMDAQLHIISMCHAVGRILIDKGICTDVELTTEIDKSFLKGQAAVGDIGPLVEALKETLEEQKRQAERN